MKRLLFLCVGATLFAQTPLPVRSWTEADQFEAQLDAAPDNVATRTQLLRYYYGQSQASPERVAPLRRKHVLWLIEHHPEAPVLSEVTGLLTADEACRAAWEKALAAPRPLFDTYANAANFFKAVGLARARRIVDEGLARYPGNSRIVDRKGQLLAMSILSVKTIDAYGYATAFDDSDGARAQAAKDRQALEASSDAYELGAVGRALQMQLNALTSHNRKALVGEVEDLILRLFRRAAEFDPNSLMWKSSIVSSYQVFAASAPNPSEKLALLEKALSAAAVNYPAARPGVLAELARQYLAAGDTEKAATTARELLATNLDKTNFTYSNAIASGNPVLGRIALAKGDADEAARRLLAAGRAPASQGNPNGPSDWRLAEDLLAAGDRDTVVEYLGLLRNSWTSGVPRLNGWIATIRKGGTPTFSASVDFPKDRYTGRAAPELRLKNLEGAEVTLADYRGKVVLLDFWATWCGPCREEMPEFEKIHRGDAGSDVVVLALDVDEAQEVIVEYLAKQKYTFPILLGKGTGVVERFGVHAFPTTFAIDKQGLVADVIVGGGPNGRVRLDALIARARAGAPAATPDAPLKIVPRTATAEDLYRDAVRLHAAKDYEGAVDALTRALKLRPDWLAAIGNRADAEYHAKHYDEAIAGFTRAIELDPKRSASYDGRGLAYSYSNRHAQAIPDYTRAIELAPSSAVAYNNRGWAYLETGRLDEALADLNRALELNPAYTLALFNRAHLFEKRQEFPKAIADYDAVLRVEPDNASAETQKATTLRRMKTPPVSAFGAKAAGGGSVIRVGERDSSNCIPFGCPWSLNDARTPLVAYQQVYAADAFGDKPVRIAALTFYSKGHDPSIIPATYTFRLGTTEAAVGALGRDRDANVGGGAVVFWSGVLHGDVADSFTITGTTPFEFDPAAGRNLILDIGIDGQTVLPRTVSIQGLFARDASGSKVTGRAIFVTSQSGTNSAAGLATGFTVVDAPIRVH
jgi:tetratricopeptide (TPR) repeat protein/thiol-disulfide isomerase/thioredoxin